MDRLSRRDALRGFAGVAGGAWVLPHIHTSSTTTLPQSGTPGPGGCQVGSSIDFWFNNQNPGRRNCVRTRDYWKTHSSHGPGPYDPAWEIVGEDTPFFRSGKTYYQAITTDPRSNAYYLLAGEFIAAKLNVAAGATMPCGVQWAYNMALSFFQCYTPAQVARSRTLQQKAQCLANSLSCFNNGRAGIPSCDDRRSHQCGPGVGIWFNASMSVTLAAGVTSVVEILFRSQKITFDANGTTYVINVPNSLVRFSPFVNAPSTFFDEMFNRWVTQVPLSTGPTEVFLGGLMWAVPAAGFPVGANPVTWNGTFTLPPEVSQVCWHWGAAVYSSYPGNPDQFGVVARDGTQQAGTPWNLRSKLLPGGTGNGASNYTGDQSQTDCVDCSNGGGGGGNGGGGHGGGGGGHGGGGGGGGGGGHGGGGHDDDDDDDDGGHGGGGGNPL
ncbi:MAG: hypothetical protein K1X95_08055 [Acidimicrobiia bacterium]|nr:hypothetical protein [Acidimicrobiia bacterium]